MAALKGFYNNLKTRDKLFAVFAAMLLIVLVICYQVIYYALGLYGERLYDEFTRTLDASCGTIEQVMSRTEEMSLRIVSDPTVQLNLNKIRDGADGYEKYMAMENTMNRVSDTIAGAEAVSGIVLVDAQGQQQWSGSQRTFFSEEALRELQALPGIESGGCLWVKERPDDAYALCIQRIRLIDNLQLDTLGTLLIRVEMGDIVRGASRIFPRFSGFAMLRNGEVWFSQGAAEEGVAALPLADARGYRVETLHRQKTILAYLKSQKFGFTCVVTAPYGEAFAEYRRLEGYVLALFAVLLALALALSRRLSQNLTRPIEYLAGQMEQVQDGDFTAFRQDSGLEARGDEAGLLYRSFASMLRRISALIDENYTKELMLTRTELQALQAQINPHFLYNTLETIRLLAKGGQGEQVARIAEALGSIMRNAVDNRTYLHPLSDELALLEDYLYIQRVRYEERLQVTVEAEEGVGSILIPRFILQPLVENSIKYGAEHSSDACRVRVRCGLLSPGPLELSVADNGPGIPPARAQAILDGTFRSDSTGIGILNIHQRIRRLFGEGYGLQIDRGEDGGTRIVIHLPAQGGSAFAQGGREEDFGVQAGIGG